MTTPQNIPIPEDFSFTESVEKVLKEVLAPVARLETLKAKPHLTPKEVKALYGIPTQSLSTWRCRGGGPDFIQPYKNGPVFYTHEAIKAFQSRNKVRGSLHDG